MKQKVKLIIQIIVFILFLIIVGIIYQNIVNEKYPDEKVEEEISKVEVLKITNKNYEKEVKNSETPVLLDFWASWCMPCRMMSPIVEEIAQEVGEQAKVGKVNVDEEQELAMQFQVMSIPTLVIIKNGEVVKTFVGVQDKETILKELL